MAWTQAIRHTFDRLNTACWAISICGASGCLRRASITAASCSADRRCRPLLFCVPQSKQCRCDLPRARPSFAGISKTTCRPLPHCGRRNSNSRGKEWRFGPVLSWGIGEAATSSAADQPAAGGQEPAYRSQGRGRNGTRPVHLGRLCLLRRLNTAFRSLYRPGRTITFKTQFSQIAVSARSDRRKSHCAAVRMDPGPVRQEKPQCHDQDRAQAAANLGNSGRSEIENCLAISRAAGAELENFLDVLTRRIASETQPNERACWRAHKACDGRGNPPPA